MIISIIHIIYNNIKDGLYTMAKEEGVRGLYKGLFPGLLLTSHGAIQVRIKIIIL